MTSCMTDSAPDADYRAGGLYARGTSSDAPGKLTLPYMRSLGSGVVIHRRRGALGESG